MIEVLVAIVILTFGLLGLAGLQSRLQISEVEAYQRSQALILLNDMASRLAANRRNAAAYAAAATTGSPVGASVCPTDTSTQVKIDIKAWCEGLRGASEVNSASASVGTLVGGRGCIEPLSTGSNEYIITVAWKGFAPLSAPSANLRCGLGNYGSEAPCANDVCRRVVTTLVKAPNL